MTTRRRLLALQKSGIRTDWLMRGRCNSGSLSQYSYSICAGDGPMFVADYGYPSPLFQENTFRVIALPPMIHPWVRVTLNWAISTTPLNFGHLPNLKSAMVVALSIGRQLQDHLISFVLDRLLVGVHNQVLISHGAREGFPRRSS